MSEKKGTEIDCALKRLMDAGAASPVFAKGYDELSDTGKRDKPLVWGIRLLRMAGYVKKAGKGKFYLDLDAIEHQKKTQVKSFFKLFAVVFGVFLLVTVIALLIANLF